MASCYLVFDNTQEYLSASLFYSRLLCRRHGEAVKNVQESDDHLYGGPGHLLQQDRAGRTAPVGGHDSDDRHIR